MTKEEMILHEKSEVLNEIAVAFSVVEFHKVAKSEKERDKKEAARYEAKFKDLLARAIELGIPKSRIDIYVEHGKEMAKESLEEQGYI